MMSNTQKIIFLIIILVILKLWNDRENFACSDHNNAVVINYNACYNDSDESCTVMDSLSGKAFCTKR